MAVFRVEKTKDYTVMANHHLKNKDLSLKAKGLLSQMLSLPDDWDYTLKGLSTINKESVDAIREAVKELERAGYIERTRSRNQMGHLKGTDYTIFEKPQLEPIRENPILDKPIQDYPIRDKPILENPTQLNTKAFNTNLSKTYVENTHPSIRFKQNKTRSMDSIGYDDYHHTKSMIQQQIEYDIILERYDQDRLDELVEIMTEVLCSNRKVITIAGDDLPASMVIERLRKIYASHIEYVFSCLDQVNTPIRNIKKYLLATLFNAPITIDNYYTNQVKQYP
jgi:hypothetical protein